MSDHYQAAEKWVLPFWVLYSGTIVLAFVLFFMKPGTQDYADWIPRVGSFITALAFIAEYPAIKIHQSFNDVTFAGPRYSEAREKFGKYPKRMTVAVVALIIVGTILNGFGDLLPSGYQWGLDSICRETGYLN